MTLYEKHIGRPSEKSDLEAEREWYISRILSRDQMESRRKLMKKETPKQLSLF